MKSVTLPVAFVYGNDDGLIGNEDNDGRAETQAVTRAICGWDLGGAQLKLAFARDARLLWVKTLPCPLWQGLAHLQQAFNQTLGAFPEGCEHRFTMTAELVDLFADRHDGVQQVVNLVRARVGADGLYWFAGRRGWLNSADALNASADIASANWLASIDWLAAHCRAGVLVDIGSTTTDLIAFDHNGAMTSSVSDLDRLRADELIYTGVVRSPIASLSQRAPLHGRWQGLCAEYFASTADVYRILGQLPEHADLLPSADGREKTLAASEARLARMFGCDASDVPSAAWHAAAEFLARRQRLRLGAGLERILTLPQLSADAPVIGAGVGRFVVAQLALEYHRPFIDAADWFLAEPGVASAAADCAPAAALALAMRSDG